MFDVLEGFDAEWDPKEKEWQDKDSANQNYEEWNPSEKPIHKFEVRFTVTLKNK